MMFKNVFNHSSHSVTGAAIIIAGATLLNKFVGLARDRLLAHYFGASPVMDAYYAAFKIPDLIYNLLIVGALTAGFIPVFTKLYYQNEDKAKAWTLANNVLNIFGVALVALCGLGIIFTPWLAKIIAPGFSAESQRLTVSFIRVIFFSPLILGLSMVVGGILQSLRRFVLYSLAPIFYNLGIIVGIIWLVPAFGLKGLPLGVVLGALAHLAVQTYGAIQAGWRWRWQWNWRDADTRVIGKLMLPRTLGLAITNLNSVAITMLASLLPIGSVAVYNYADNLQWVPIGVIGIPFALAAFPALAAAGASNDKEKFVRDLSATARQILFLIIPLSLVFMLLRAQIVRVVLGSGAFDWAATINTADALAFFSLGLFAQSLAPLFARGFFALEDTLTPFVASVISALSGIILALLLMEKLGVAGLALAASLSAILNFAILAIALRQKIGNLEEGTLLKALFKISVAALFMAVTVQSLKRPLTQIFDLHYFWGIFGQGAVAGLAGLAVYGLGCYLLRLPEFTAMKESFQRRWLKVENIPTEVEMEEKK